MYEMLAPMQEICLLLRTRNLSVLAVSSLFLTGQIAAASRDKPSDKLTRLAMEEGGRQRSSLGPRGRPAGGGSSCCEPESEPE